MNRTIEFFYDLMSPYSHLADRRLPGIAKRSAAVVVHRPIALPQLLELAGNSHPAELELKRDYIRNDLNALAGYYGIAVEWPQHWPIDSSRAMAALALVEGRVQAELAQELFEAVWVQGLDIADPQVLESLLPTTLFERSLEPEAQQLLAQNTQEAFERGAFGVPSSFVGQRLFFGNDSLVLMQRYLNA